MNDIDLERNQGQKGKVRDFYIGASLRGRPKRVCRKKEGEVAAHWLNHSFGRKMDFVDHPDSSLRRSEMFIDRRQNPSGAVRRGGAQLDKYQSSFIPPLRTAPGCFLGSAL